MRQPRVAELVASDLRKQILEGEITQDSALPRQEELQAQFGVSLPSIREALRILEGEGLITVRRGNRGGAVVHLPTMRSFVYMQSLLLQSRRTTLSDVALALQRFEPTCAAMCAERTDLTTSLVPVLEALLLEQREGFDAQGLGISIHPPVLQEFSVDSAFHYGEIVAGLSVRKSRGSRYRRRNTGGL